MIPSADAFYDIFTCIEPGHRHEVREKYHQFGLTPPTIDAFNRSLFEYYDQCRRPFAWRDERTPYRVLISECMLQQTQTDRVKYKFEEFISRFPSLTSLAQAPFEDVLAVWRGLGYNRRARFLKEAACTIETQYAGQIPNDAASLSKLPGIGPHTAGAIVAFAFNKPAYFLETNVRAVLIHFFFAEHLEVADKELMALLPHFVDLSRVRDWYYAIVDYGVMVKRCYKNPTRKSAHYQVQSKFEGSDRQLRGKILALLLQYGQLTLDACVQELGADHDRVGRLINDLARDRLLTEKDSLISISS